MVDEIEQLPIPLLTEKKKSLIIHGLTILSLIAIFLVYQTVTGMQKTGELVCYSWKPLADQADSCVKEGGRPVFQCAMYASNYTPVGLPGGNAS